MKKNKNLTVILALMAGVALYFYMRRKKATTTTTTTDILPSLPVSEPELTPRMRPAENLEPTTEPVLEVSELDFDESEQPTEFNDFDVV